MGKSPGGWHNSAALPKAKESIPVSPFHNLGGNKFGWRYDDDRWCIQIPCRRCGELVFLIHYNGGYASFDSLGKPWPKHPCYAISERLNHVKNYSSLDNPISDLAFDSHYMQSFTDTTNLFVGLVSEVDDHPKTPNQQVIIRRPDGEKYKVRIPRKSLIINPDGIRCLIGEIVVVSEIDYKMICVGSKLVVSFYVDIEYIPGNLYRHDVFGRGKLLHVKTVKDGYDLAIRFEKFGLKTIRANYVRLTPG